MQHIQCPTIAVTLNCCFWCFIHVNFSLYYSYYSYYTTNLVYKSLYFGGKLCPTIIASTVYIPRCESWVFFSERKRSSSVGSCVMECEGLGVKGFLCPRLFTGASKMCPGAPSGPFCVLWPRKQGPHQIIIKTSQHVSSVCSLADTFDTWFL